MKAHEQFDKLAEQCYVKTGSIHTDHFDYVKFAELIVAECVDTVLDCSVEYTTRPQIASEIKEHFGVER